jgi:fructoselysine-6-phosphate deglycase
MLSDVRQYASPRAKDAMTMLNFDADRFLRIQSGAVGLAAAIDAAIGRLLAEGAANIFFLGTGGAAILMRPAAQLLQRSSAMRVVDEMSAELVLSGNRHLGKGSIAVIPSRSGTTRESIEALRFCQAKGACVIALTAHAGTPIADAADHAFVNFAEDDTSSESFYLQSLLIALSIMRHRGEYDAYQEVVGELQHLPGLLLEVKRAFEPRAEQLAEAIKSADYHIITGAGSTWPEAFYYGMCILEEMQWIRTRPVHASDFFHGTLELVERGVSLILFKGEDQCRPLVQRVEDFAPAYTDRLNVIDTATMSLPGISDRLRPLISPILLATVLERVNAHLEVKRAHPLTTRRYYKKVAY